MLIRSRVRRQDLLVAWRIALLIPGALPMRTVGLGLLLLVWVLVCWVIWPVGLLLGAGTAVDIAVSLLGRRGDRLLQELDTSTGTEDDVDVSTGPRTAPGPGPGPVHEG